MGRWRSSIPIKTDQVCQFTSHEFTELLTQHGISHSNQYGRKRLLAWQHFRGAVWKSTTYEEVYLHVYETVGAVQEDLARYLTFYNQTRPH